MKNKIYKLLSVVMSLVMIASTPTVLTGLSASAVADTYTTETDYAYYDSGATNKYNELVTLYGDNILKDKPAYARTSVYTSTIVAKTEGTWAKITDGNPAAANDGVHTQQTTYIDSNGTHLDAGRYWYFDLSDMTEIEQITLFNEINPRESLALCAFEIYVSDDVSTLWQEANKVCVYNDNENNTVKNFNIIKIAFNEKPQGKYLGFYWTQPCNFEGRDGTNLNGNVRLTEIAAFGKKINTITANAGAGGTISPSGTNTVQTGSNATYTITPDSGYNIKDVLVDGVSVGAVSSYTFQNVTENHTITASFASEYTIQHNYMYTFTEEKYNELLSAYGANRVAGLVPYSKKNWESEYTQQTGDWLNLTDGSVTTTHTTTVTNYQFLYFELANTTEISLISLFNQRSASMLLQLKGFEMYVSDSASTLFDESNMVVDYDLAEIGTDDTRNDLLKIEFNSKPVGKYVGFKWNDPANFRPSDGSGGSTATFVTAELAVFGKQTNTITAIAGNGGTITPSGETSVTDGQNAVYNITANSGSYISKLLVDGIEVTEAVGKTEYTYTFNAVSANHTISVEFFVPYSFTNEFVSKDDLASKYNEFVSENGENLLSGAAPYGHPENLDHNFVDKTADWGSLTDGDAQNGPWEANTDDSKRTLRGYKDSLYFEFDNIVDLDKLVIFNYFASMRDGLQIANFDVFVGNNADTLWDESNVVASYDASQVSANGKAKVITLNFNQDRLARGKYLGIRWNAPYNFESSQSVVLTEIAAFGTECATVVADVKGSGTVSSYDAIELDSNVEYTFTPDKGYKVVDVLVDSASVGASETLTVTADGKSHKVEVEFAIIGDTDNNHDLNATDIAELRKALLEDVDYCDEKYANVNGDSVVDICDIVKTAVVLNNMDYDEDITMLADGLGIDYFDIQDALERGDDLNNISNVNTARVQQVIQKAMNGEPITLSVIGGSITEGAYNSKNSEYASDDVNAYFGNKSYAEWVQKWFADKFYSGDASKVTLVNAGIGATPSLLGSFRLQSMVLDKKPDLVIVEFSCNDFSTISYPDSDIYLGKGAYEAYEAIVRRCLEDDVAVMQLFMGHTEERGLWTMHRVIGSYYNVPMVSFENAVYPNDTCILSDTTRVYYDGVHPNNVGHAFVGKVISNYLDKIYANSDADDVYTASEVPTDCVYGDTYTNANNTILYAGDNQNAASGSFSYKASVSGVSAKWGGAYVADGSGEGTVTATIPAGVKRVYVVYYATATGSFTTALAGSDATTSYKSESRATWSTAYNGAALAEDTTITLTSSDTGLNVIGFMLEYDDVKKKINLSKMNYKTQGRTFVDSKGLALEYTASSFEFNANCEGDVYLNLELANLVSETEERGIYFTVYVDGVKQDRICAYGSGNHALKIASDLKPGDHTFAIYRQTEIEHGTVYIDSVTLQGEVTAAPENNEKLIQVIGASSVAGYGNLGNTSTESTIAGYPVYEDGTQSFGFLLAQKLGADVDMIAQQGIGVQYGWRNANMQTVYNYRNYQHDTQTTFDFANTRKPDIVVISLGGNDISCLGSGGLGKDLPKDETSYNAIQNGMESFLTTLRSYYPNAKIIWEVGVVASSSNEKGAEIIKNAVNAAGGEQSGFYFVDLREEGITNTSGAKNHPSAAEHAAFADAINAYIINKGLAN